jgi:hypothetical protein
MARENWLNAFIFESASRFAELGTPLPEKVRASIGFTSKGNRARRIGECWTDAASKDGTFEIFIHPVVESDARIADVLTHELVHAAVGLAAGHGPAFRKLAVALGLTGPMTATTAGPDWYAWAGPLLAKLGPFPGAPLAPAGAASTGPKAQRNRHVKLACLNCGWHCRTSRSPISDTLVCPVCQSPAFGPNA